MIEIQLRIVELEDRLQKLEKLPKRLHASNHENEISSTEGEIKGLRWCLNHCYNISPPNLIEQ